MFTTAKEISQARTQAASRAKTKLVDAYRAEYIKLYHEELESIGLAGRSSVSAVYNLHQRVKELEAELAIARQG